MDSGSTPGNPYISEGEGHDIYQKAPYTMPIIRRSTIFQREVGCNKAAHKRNTRSLHIKMTTTRT